jgi:hypothetical protein
VNRSAGEEGLTIHFCIRLDPFPLGFAADQCPSHAASDKTACDDDEGRSQDNPAAPLDVRNEQEHIDQESKH